MQEGVFRKIIVGVVEKAPDRTPRRHCGVVQGAALFAQVVVGDIQFVCDVEMQQDPLQLFRGEADENLFVRVPLFGNVLV